MPVGIVEVMNNTSRLLHYTNQESGYTFTVNPTTRTYGDGGYISTSQFKDDTVPYKTSNKRIIVTVNGGGPQVAICDDNYHFSVSGNSKPEEKLTVEISNGEQFVLKVDDDGIGFIKYNPGLRASDAGYVPIGAIPKVLSVIGDAYFSIKF